MSILTIVQDAADELAGLARPSAAVNSTERETQRLLRFAYRTGDELLLKREHPSTIRPGTATLVASQTTYALPADYLRMLPDITWDNANHWMMLGPYTPQEWQTLIRGVALSIPRRAFRVEGRGDSQFEISSAPSASEAGNIISFEYISETWLLPATWVTGTTYAAGAYTSYNGIIYSTVLGGLATGTGGPTTDTVVWVLSTATYNRARADSDYSLFDENVISLGVIWRYLRAIGGDYAEAEAEFDAAVDTMVAGYRGSRTISFAPQRLPWMIGPWNVPDSF